MHTLSTRIMVALAYERGEEYDPGQPLCPALLDDLELASLAGPVIGEDGTYDRQRQRRRERRELAGIPEWFAAEDLLARPWERSIERLV